ncbi:MAG: hypothetical protein ACWA5P_09090 [bacterium]
MYTKYLLSNKFKRIGWFLLTVSIATGILLYTDLLESELLKVKVLSIYHEGFMSSNDGFFRIVENGILDEIVAILIIIGGLLVGFSKEKIEDEYIYQLRKESLIWAIIANYVILLLAIVFVYDMTFFNVLIFNMFTPLIFFIIRFNFLKYKSAQHEE